MKVKKLSWMLPILILGMFVMFSNSCKKDSTSSNNNILSYSDSLIYNDSISYGTVTDFDGNIYKTDTIGTQIWMASNLKAIHYNNGDAIANITDNTAWGSTKTGAYCNYNNDVTLGKIFGKLYNYYAVADGRNLCPTGWHVATDSNWITLTEYLKGATIAGANLKETGTTHWTIPNLGALNDSGFTALPGGYRTVEGNFSYIGTNGEWWTASIDSMYGAWDRYMEYNSTKVGKCGVLKNHGFSVRCIKNN